jgi:magnesium chelatase family protein
LIGGGRGPSPGEASLAHHGVLFLDELPEFQRNALEALRQPMEEGSVTIARVGGSVRFPASFSFIGAMNPCPCGHRGDPARACLCGSEAIARYWSKISGPILDRLDLVLEVRALPVDDLLAAEGGEPSDVVRGRVLSARSRSGFRNRDGAHNARIDERELTRFAPLGPDARELLARAASAFSLSARGFVRVRRVALTIADLEGSERVTTSHLAEALQFRGSAARREERP